MQISEVQALLETIKKQHGDLVVTFKTEDRWSNHDNYPYIEGGNFTIMPDDENPGLMLAFNTVDDQPEGGELKEYFFNPVVFCEILTFEDPNPEATKEYLKSTASFTKLFEQA